MGTFIRGVDKSKGIPKEKQDEFRERIKILFQEGGMMKVQWQSLFDKTIVTISPVEYEEENYIDFTYNYFEDREWENAGFNGDTCQVYSNKVGWSYFNFVMRTAYVLQGLYSDGDFVTFENKPLIGEEKYCIEWINDLFDEHYSWKNWDIIKVCDLVKYDDNDEEFRLYREKYIGMGYGYDPFVSWFEAYAVQYGIDEMEKYDADRDRDKADKLIEYTLKNREAVKEFKESSSEDEDKQVEILIGIINQYINNDYDFSEKYNMSVFQFIVSLMLMNSSNLALQSISEVYGIDFIKLYHRLDHHERVIVSGMNDILYSVPPYSFFETFDIQPENMIYFWKEDKNISISPYLESWFQELKTIYDKYIQETVKVEHPIMWIIDLLDYAENNYCQIYAFTDCLKETFENINDQKYLVLWKIFEDMIYDKTMYQNGSVIFRSEENEYSKWDGLYRRRLNENWSFMPRDKKWNSSRLKLRGYLALIANKELRNKVFGF